MDLHDLLSAGDDSDLDELLEELQRHKETSEALQKKVNEIEESTLKASQFSVAPKPVTEFDDDICDTPNPTKKPSVVEPGPASSSADHIPGPLEDKMQECGCPSPASRLDTTGGPTNEVASSSSITADPFRNAERREDELAKRLEQLDMDLSDVQMPKEMSFSTASKSDSNFLETLSEQEHRALMWLMAKDNIQTTQVKSMEESFNTVVHSKSSASKETPPLELCECVPHSPHLMRSIATQQSEEIIDVDHILEIEKEIVSKGDDLESFLKGLLEITSNPDECVKMSEAANELIMSRLKRIEIARKREEHLDALFARLAQHKSPVARQTREEPKSETASPGDSIPKKSATPHEKAQSPIANAVPQSKPLVSSAGSPPSHSPSKNSMQQEGSTKPSPRVADASASQCVSDSLKASGVKAQTSAASLKSTKISSPKKGEMSESRDLRDQSPSITAHLALQASLNAQQCVDDQDASLDDSNATEGSELCSDFEECDEPEPDEIVCAVSSIPRRLVSPQKSDLIIGNAVLPVLPVRTNVKSFCSKIIQNMNERKNKKIVTETASQRSVVIQVDEHEGASATPKHVRSEVGNEYDEYSAHEETIRLLQERERRRQTPNSQKRHLCRETNPYSESLSSRPRQECEEKDTSVYLSSEVRVVNNQNLNKVDSRPAWNGSVSSPSFKQLRKHMMLSRCPTDRASCTFKPEVHEPAPRQLFESPLSKYQFHVAKNLEDEQKFISEELCFPSRPHPESNHLPIGRAHSAMYEYFNSLVNPNLKAAVSSKTEAKRVDLVDHDRGDMTERKLAEELYHTPTQLGRHDGRSGGSSVMRTMSKDGSIRKHKSRIEAGIVANWMRRNGIDAQVEIRKMSEQDIRNLAAVITGDGLRGLEVVKNS